MHWWYTCTCLCSPSDVSQRINRMLYSTTVQALLCGSSKYSIILISSVIVSRCFQCHIVLEAWLVSALASWILFFYSPLNTQLQGILVHTMILIDPLYLMKMLRDEGLFSLTQVGNSWLKICGKVQDGTEICLWLVSRLNRMLTIVPCHFFF